MDDEIKSNRAPKLKCGHRMCHSCLRRNFKLSLTDPQQMPPKCCTANAIPLRVVDTLFRSEWKKNWSRKYEEYTTKNRIYCPAKKCGEWIRPDDIKKVDGKKQGVCRKCKTKVCGTCNAKWHGARDCPKDAEMNALLETAREAGWQRCYSCRTLVELKEGCNHMTWYAPFAISFIPTIDYVLFNPLSTTHFLKTERDEMLTPQPLQPLQSRILHALRPQMAHLPMSMVQLRNR